MIQGETRVRVYKRGPEGTLAPDYYWDLVNALSVQSGEQQQHAGAIRQAQGKSAPCGLRLRVRVSAAGVSSRRLPSLTLAWEPENGAWVPLLPLLLGSDRCAIKPSCRPVSIVWNRRGKISDAGFEGRGCTDCGPGSHGSENQLQKTLISRRVT
jgi:hypothetical protein